MKSALIFTILAFLSAFQNCANQVEIHTTMAQSHGNAMDPSTLAVDASVTPRSDSLPTNGMPVDFSHQALPWAIDFAANPSASPVTQNSWGTWIYDWLNNSPAQMQYLGQPLYQYRLDVIKFTVTDFNSHQIVYELKTSEIQQLNGMLANSVIAPQGAGSCTSSSPQAYATLETDGGMFDLGSAEKPCQPVDLYHTNGAATGLQAFLQQLSGNFQVVAN